MSEQQDMIDVLVIGGVADGVYIRNVPVQHRYINLSKPTFVKPLASSTQQQPDVEVESADYFIYHFDADTEDDDVFVKVGIATPLDSNMFEAFKSIVIKYTQRKLDEMIEDDEIDLSRTDKVDLRKFDA